MLYLDAYLTASEALFRTDFLAYRAALIQFRQEQEAAADGEAEEVAE